MNTSDIKNAMHMVIDTTTDCAKRIGTRAAIGYVSGYTVSAITGGVKDISSDHKMGLTVAAFASLINLTYEGTLDISSYTFSKISGIPAREFKDAFIMNLFSSIVAFRTSQLAINQISPDLVDNFKAIPLDAGILMLAAFLYLKNMATERKDGFIEPKEIVA